MLVYDASAGEWRRTSIDVLLSRAVLRGKREGTRVILHSADRTRRRILEPAAADRVLEHDEHSTDGGQS